MEFIFAPAREHPVVSGVSTSSPIDSQSQATSGEDIPMSCNEAEVPAISDPESVQPKRSTLADAIAAPVKNCAPALSESSYVSPEEAIHRTGGPAPLSINSQELIRTYFEKTPSFNFHRDTRPSPSTRNKLDTFYKLLQMRRQEHHSRCLTASLYVLVS